MEDKKFFNAVNCIRDGELVFVKRNLNFDFMGVHIVIMKKTRSPKEYEVVMKTIEALLEKGSCPLVKIFVF